MADSLLWVAGDRALELSEEAVAVARRLSDRSAMLESLGGRHACLLHAEHVDERLEVSRERLTIAQSSIEHEKEAADAKPAREQRDRESAAAALHWYIFDLMERGETRAAKEHHARLAEIAAELGEPLYMSYARHWASVFAQLHGRFAEAERLADEAFELSKGIHAEIAEMQGLDKRFAIYREQGRLQELRPAVERFAVGAPGIVAWTGLLALLDAESGEAARARPRVDRLVARDAAAVPRDVFWLMTLAALAETCAILDDAAAPGATLHQLLLPHAELCVQAGSADACWGSASRFLGLAATACGNWDAADRHFLTATRRNEQIGSAPLVARARVDHAGMLLRQGDRARSGDIEDLLAEATAVAEPMGMVDVCRRAKRLRLQAAGSAVLA